MQTVPREYLENYDGALSQIRESAKEQLKAALGRIDYGADPTLVREAVCGVMQATCDGASKMAAGTSAAFYDGLRERVVGSQMGAFAQDGRSSEGTDKAVRAFLKKLFDGDEEEFEQLCLDRLDYEVTAAAGRCMEFNARNDPDRDVRYARVPQGEKTCDFCIMLASRGPVYRTEESAGAFTQFHLHCDCKIMPFWNTYAVYDPTDGHFVGRRSGSTSYEGYDPDAYFSQYVEQMLNPTVANRMARAADNAHARSATSTNARGWAEAHRSGEVTLGSIGDVQGYIRDAESHEDLFERIKLINRELPSYGLSEKYLQLIKQEIYERRKQLIS